MKKILMVLLLVALAVSSAVSAVGISPGVVVFENMLRDGYAERVFKVYNTENVEMNFAVSADGDIKDWISYRPGATFTVPPRGMQPLTIIVKPPAYAANGIYLGSITVTGMISSTATQGASVAVSTAVAVRTSVEITDKQIVNGEVFFTSVNTTEEKLPIFFSVLFKNLGNVKVKPVVRIEILNQDKTTVLKSREFSEIEVLPTVVQDLVYSISSEGLPPGQYWMRIKVFVGGTQVHEGEVGFDILEKGALARNGEFVSLLTPPWVSVGDIVKITAVFKNTGEISTPVRFVGEIYLDEELVSNIQSDEVDVDVGSTSELAMYYKPTKDGRYTVKGFIKYGKKITPKRDAVFNVLPKAVQAAGGDNTLVIVGFLFALTIAIGLFAFRKHLLVSFEKK